MPQEYDGLVAAAVEKSPLVRKAARYVRELVSQKRQAFTEVLANNKMASEVGDFDELTVDAFEKAVVSSIEGDIAGFTAYNDPAVPKTIPGGKDTKFALTGNKMAHVLGGALELSRKDSVTFQLMQGIMPELDGFNGTMYPVLGTSNFWGNNQYATWTSALLATRFVGVKERAADYMHSLVNVFTAPALPPAFEACNYSYSHNGVKGICTVGLYGFGGSRYNPLEPTRFHPHDASSFVAELTDAPVPYTTPDLMYVYRAKIGGSYDQEVWAKQGWGVQLLPFFGAGYDVVKTVDVQAGDILFSRKFKEGQAPETDLGIGGSMGIVVGPNPKTPGEVLCFAANRDRTGDDDPKYKEFGMDGIGLVSFPLLPVPAANNPKVMVQSFALRQKPAAAPAPATTASGSTSAPALQW